MSARTEPDLVLHAVAHGVTGDRDTGLGMLQPLVDAGPTSTYTLACQLAETVALKTRRYPRDIGWAFEIVGPDGEVQPVEETAAPLRFAARFVAARASYHNDTALALYLAVAQHADTHGTSDLAEAIVTLYDLAVAACATIVEERRRLREQGSNW
jgi:hypothetical protein